MKKHAGSEKAPSIIGPGANMHGDGGVKIRLADAPGAHTLDGHKVVALSPQRVREIADAWRERRGIQ